VLRVEAVTRLRSFELDVRLEVPAGSCLALAGPSGAGKSTVLRIVAGLVRPEHGRVECQEHCWLDTTRAVDVAPERRGCGYVFQDYALFGHLRVWQNVAYGLRRHGRAERRRRADELLERFGIAHLAGARPRDISGGERQRVALARALARRPSALLLDEPLSALDARTRARAARELGVILRDIDVPTVLVTHDFAEAALLGDELAVVDDGRIIQGGSATELAAAPATAFVADFAGAVVLTGTASAGREGLTVVALDGGGTVWAVGDARGDVAVSVFPWEIALAPPDAASASSAQNCLSAEVVSITQVGGRVRVGLAAPQPLIAEVTVTAAREMGLAAGSRVTATWKATATRLLDV
jgi:molybdate transport system ATP-binding protein